MSKEIVNIIALSIVFFIGVETSTASTAVVNINPDPIIVYQGENFYFDIIINAGENATSGAQTNLLYDPGAIAVNSVIEGNFYIKNGTYFTYYNSGTINNSVGSVINIFNVILGPYNVTGAGSFIRVNATAVGVPSNSWINLSNCLISDPDANAVWPLITNGSLTILPAREMNYVNGTVTDSSSMLPIFGVEVHLSEFYTLTNETGFYSLSVPEGEYNLTARLGPVYYANSIISISTIGVPVTEQNIELAKKPTGSISGSVRN